MIHLSEEERAAFTRYIYEISAISLDDSKAYLIEGRLGDLVREAGVGSFSELLTRARSGSGDLKRKIIDAITTGETLFFRDTAPFDLLKHKILPDLFDRRSRSGSKLPIRIWSAACSTGQELYSVAITIRQLLGPQPRYAVRLLGTDISSQAVAAASKGFYSSLEIARGLDDAMRANYFLRRDNGWQIRDELRAMASFRTLSLMDDFSFLGRFDIILCRNVAIYFAERDRTQLFHRLERSMEQEGYLMVGAMESLSGICPQFESKRYLRSVYYQVRAQQQRGLAREANLSACPTFAR